jgi:hypothetical protein
MIYVFALFSFQLWPTPRFEEEKTFLEVLRSRECGQASFIAVLCFCASCQNPSCCISIQFLFSSFVSHPISVLVASQMYSPTSNGIPSRCRVCNHLDPSVLALRNAPLAARVIPSHMLSTPGFPTTLTTSCAGQQKRTSSHHAVRSFAISLARRC